MLALEPKGVPLSALLIDEHDIVVSTNFASGRDLNVGDSVHVSGTSDLFTVKGIVSADEEAGLNDLIAAFFGFVYLDQRSAGIIGRGNRPQPHQHCLPLKPRSTSFKRRVTLTAR
ncbi:MAG UNVERIFIED_CONTAM: hypothetical protein LVT10_19005 [Anaerolineae bacterium]